MLAPLLEIPYFNCSILVLYGSNSGFSFIFLLLPNLSMLISSLDYSLHQLKSIDGRSKNFAYFPKLIIIICCFY